MRTFLRKWGGLIFIAILSISLVVLKLHIDERRHAMEKAETEKAKLERESERKKFNEDFTDVSRLLMQRDEVVYSIMLERTERVLSIVKTLQESGNEEKSEYRRTLENELRRELQREIRDFRRKKEKIVEHDDWENKGRLELYESDFYIERID